VPTGLVTVPFFLALRASDKLLLGLIRTGSSTDGTELRLRRAEPRA